MPGKHNAGCQCCSCLCPFCGGTCPDEVEIVIAGWDDDTCTTCDEVNGAYIATLYNTYSALGHDYCEWRIFVDGEDCPFEDGLTIYWQVGDDGTSSLTLWDGDYPDGVYSPAAYYVRDDDLDLSGGCVFDGVEYYTGLASYNGCIVSEDPAHLSTATVTAVP